MNNTEKDVKPVPAYLRADYPFRAAEAPAMDSDTLEPDRLCQIRCPACEMSIRAQAQKLRPVYGRLKDSGCLNCGNRELILSTLAYSDEGDAEVCF